MRAPKRDFAGRLLKPMRRKWPKFSGRRSGIRVLSLFDGIGTGRLVLENLGIRVAEYHASEIHKASINLAMQAYPSITQIGDVCDVEGRLYEGWDLLIGGSPCQNVSVAGAVHKADTGLEGEKSMLFYEYRRVWREMRPKWFLYENVSFMRKDARDEITYCLGTEPVEIDAAPFSAQRRRRLFWTNIPIAPVPKDRGYRLKHILVDNPDPALTLSSGEMAYMSRATKGGRSHWEYNCTHDAEAPKSRAMLTNLKRGCPYNVVIDSQLTARKFERVEVARLMGLPDGYLNHPKVAYSTALGCAGGGWSVPVIEHILEGMRGG